MFIHIHKKSREVTAVKTTESAKEKTQEELDRELKDKIWAAQQRIYAMSLVFA